MNSIRFGKTLTGNIDLNKVVSDDGVLVQFDDRMTDEVFLGLNWRLNSYTIKIEEGQDSIVVDRFVKLRFDPHFNTVLKVSKFVDDKDHLSNWTFIPNVETYSVITKMLKWGETPRLINTVPIEDYIPQYVIPQDYTDIRTCVKYGNSIINEKIKTVLGCKGYLLLKIFLGLHSEVSEDLMSSNPNKADYRKKLEDKYSFKNNKDDMDKFIEISDIFFQAYTQVQCSFTIDEVDVIIRDMDSRLQSLRG